MLVWETKQGNTGTWRRGANEESLPLLAMEAAETGGHRSLGLGLGGRLSPHLEPGRREARRLSQGWP